jgi:glycine cleavage system H protein
MSYPDDLAYSREHEWVRVDGGRATIGITSFAADELGDIVFVELPEVGAALSQFASFGVVESVKAVSDLYAPISARSSR